MLTRRKIPVPSIGSNFDNHNSIHRKKGIYSSNILHITHYSIPIICSLVLLVLGISMINPIVSYNNGVYADEVGSADNSGEDYSMDEDVANYDIANDGISTYATGDPSISMTITSGALDQKTSATAGTVAYRTNGVKVVASNVDGYQVFVQAASGSSGTLTNGTTSVTGVGSNVAPASFGNNKWGYSLYAGSASANASTLTYNTVPESGSTLNAAYTTSAASETKNFTLAFAAKFGSTATAGEYKTNVMPSVAAGAKEVVTWSNMQYMQDMTSAICASQTTPTASDTSVPSKSLIDVRDGNTYSIAKLKDGKCWMVSNLRLMKSMVLTSADSDVTEDNYVLPSPVVLSNLYDDPKLFSTSDVAVSRVYDTGSSSKGVLYNWFTATASTGVNISQKGVNAPNSICPKGWRLPTYGDRAGEYYVLLNGVSNIMSSPYVFSYPGLVSDSQYNSANGGQYWSSTARDSVYAYAAVLNSTGTYSANLSSTNSVNRYYGNAIRCVAR